MVKKVVRPARSSVVNLALRISLGFRCQLNFLHDMVLTYMTRSIEMKVFSHNRARHGIVERSLVTLYEAHFGDVERKSKMWVNVDQPRGYD